MILKNVHTQSILGRYATELTGLFINLDKEDTKCENNIARESMRYPTGAGAIVSLIMISQKSEEHRQNVKMKRTEFLGKV